MPLSGGALAAPGRSASVQVETRYYLDGSTAGYTPAASVELVLKGS